MAAANSRFLGLSGLLAIGFLASWGVQGQPGATREAQGGSGKPREAQDQLRNERREFQENPVFRPWEASGGLRGTQNRSNWLAGANEKSVIPGHPKE